MVLTRRQEALLKKQYKIVDSLDDSDPSTPGAEHHRGGSARDEEHTGLRSALKTYHTDRPWEDREIRMMNNLPAVDTEKRVRIESEKNVVFEFEKSPGGSESVSVKRQLNLSDEDEDDGEVVQVVTMTRNRDAMMAMLMLLLWSFSSSWLTVVMQTVLSQKRMSLPLMVPALSQLGCAIVVRVLDRVKIVKLQPMPPVREYVRKIVPLGLSTCTCMFLGNYAYIGLSLSFLSILKALTPAVTLVLAVLAGMERMSGVALASTLLIAYGTGIATVDETNKDAEFHWTAFISFTTSVLFEASRVVFVSRSLKGTKFSSFDLLAGVGPLIFAIMASLSLVAERETLLALTEAEVSYLGRTMILIIALSFAVNISTYAAIKYSSSTTVKVVGCLKNALLMWFGILYQGDVVSSTQWQGFALSTGGFLLYAWARKPGEEGPQKKDTSSGHQTDKKS